MHLNEISEWRNGSEKNLKKERINGGIKTRREREREDERKNKKGVSKSKERFKRGFGWKDVL